MCDISKKTDKFFLKNNHTAIHSTLNTDNRNLTIIFGKILNDTVREFRLKNNRIRREKKKKTFVEVS